MIPVFSKNRTDGDPRRRDAAAPVVILNLSYSGLGIARDMAGHGVRVVGLSSDRRTYGNFTRACEVRFAPDARRQPERLAEFLFRAAPELGGAVIFPTSDSDVVFLDRFRSALEPHYRLSIAPADRLRKIMDKHALFRAALSAGVAAPKTVSVASCADLSAAGKEVGFPCVVKPVSSIHWHKEKGSAFASSTKALRARSLEELKKDYAEAAALYPTVLVQEWIPGGADRLAILGGYAGESSDLLAYFTAKKIIQTPDEFGTGCLVESLDIPALLEPTTRLLHSLGYRGIAEVEYKFDAATGEYKLIEINPRHWDWHRLGAASGVNLSWTAYRDLTGGPVEHAGAHTATAKWIAEDTLAHYWLKRALAGRMNARELLSDLSGQRIYGIFAWSDPVPFVRYSLTVGLPRLGKKIVDALGHKAGLHPAIAAILVLSGAVRPAS